MVEALNISDDPEGGMAVNDLQVRQTRLAAAVKVVNQGEPHEHSLPLSSLTQGMGVQPGIRGDLSDPNVIGLVGEQDQATTEVSDVKGNVTIMGVDPANISNGNQSSPADLARSLNAAVQPSVPSPSQPQLQPQPQPQVHMESPQIAAAKVPMPHAKDELVSLLLQQNHALRSSVEEMARRHGEKPSFVDTRLKNLQADSDVDPDEIERVVQVILVETKDGTRSHAVLVNGSQVNASSFRVDVDIDAGKFEFDINLRKKLFG